VKGGKGLTNIVMWFRCLRPVQHFYKNKILLAVKFNSRQVKIHTFTVSAIGLLVSSDLEKEIFFFRPVVNIGTLVDPPDAPIIRARWFPSLCSNFHRRRVVSTMILIRMTIFAKFGYNFASVCYNIRDWHLQEYSRRTFPYFEEM